MKINSKLEQNEEKEKTEKNDNNEEIIDDLFKVISEKKKNILQKKDTLNAEDNSRFIPSFIRNWDSDEVYIIFKNFKKMIDNECIIHIIFFYNIIFRFVIALEIIL